MNYLLGTAAWPDVVTIGARSAQNAAPGIAVRGKNVGLKHTLLQRHLEFFKLLL